MTDLVTENQSEKQNGLWGKFRWIFYILILVLIVSFGFFFLGFWNLYQAKASISSEQTFIYVPSRFNLDSLAQELSRKKIISDSDQFIKTALFFRYRIKAGKFKVSTNIKTIRHLLRALQGGNVPLRLTLQNHRTKDSLFEYISKHLEISKMQLDSLFADSVFKKKYQLKEDEILSFFIPNTYEFYWNVKPKDFLKKMEVEFERFWNSDRIDRANELGLSLAEIYTLASIVEAETTYGPEKSTIAGVYLNRLRKKGWRLEADPTVVFALGDFSVKRVTKEMLKLDSPYNTYKYDGLPPGPIRMASIQSIDAVLQYKKHDFMFFCAAVPQPSKPLHHEFARNLAEHAVYARKYRNWLNQKKIYK